MGTCGSVGWSLSCIQLLGVYGHPKAYKQVRLNLANLLLSDWSCKGRMAEWLHGNDQNDIAERFAGGKQALLNTFMF